MGDLAVRLTTRLRQGGTILSLILTALVLGSATSTNASSASHRVGLVIRLGDGSILTRCVSFSEPSITGLEVLMRSGLPIVLDPASPLGTRVCKISRDGCDQGKSCWCQCEGSTCAYWQYFHLQNGAWKYSALGAGAYQVSDGAIEGWAWGNNVAPPVIPFDQICAANEASITTPAPAQASSPTQPRPVTPTALSTNVTAVGTVTPPAIALTTAARSPTASSTNAPLPPSAPSRTPAPTVALSPQNTGTLPSIASYAVFGIIVLGLGMWWAIQARRKTH